MSVIEVDFPGNISQVNTATELRALPSTLIANGAIYGVSTLGIFFYDTSSVAVDDGYTVLKPNDITPLQAGRWLISGTGAFASDGDLTTLANTLTPQIQQATVFKQAGVAAVNRTTLSKAREAVSVMDFGAVGDGIADDYAAIQAALDYVGGLGGGTVRLPNSAGRYRITQGLKMPSYVELAGVSKARYPFNASNAATLVADFSNLGQWVIEPKTTHNGQPFAYNEMTTAKVGIGGGLPNGATYNCAVRDLVVTSTGILPYGGIRMHGCPGSVLDNVAAQNVGIGFLINCCFGGSYSVHALTAYYGLIAWDDVNGNNFEIYAARQGSYTGVVPDAYQSSAFAGLFNTLVSVHGLAKNDHFNRATGLVIGSTGTTSNANVIDYVGERYSNGLFSLYSYSTLFKKFYVESDANVMLTTVAGARSNLMFDTFHAYLSGGGEYFDTGFSQNMDMMVNGITFAGSWGRIQAENATFVTIRNRSVDEFGQSSPQYNVIWEKTGTWKAPTIQPGSTDSGSPDAPTGYRRERNRVFLRGNPTSVANATIFTLPVGYRPSTRVSMKDFLVTASGDVVSLINGPVYLNGASWEA